MALKKQPNILSLIVAVLLSGSQWQKLVAPHSALWGANCLGGRLHYFLLVKSTLDTVAVPLFEDILEFDKFLLKLPKTKFDVVNGQKCDETHNTHGML